LETHSLNVSLIKDHMFSNFIWHKSGKKSYFAYRRPTTYVTCYQLGLVIQPNKPPTIRALALNWAHSNVQVKVWLMADAATQTAYKSVISNIGYLFQCGKQSCH